MESIGKPTQKTINYTSPRSEISYTYPRSRRALGVIAMILAIILAVYIDRHYVAPIDFGQIAQCISSQLNRQHAADHANEGHREPPVCDARPYDRPLDTGRESSTHYEITTYDPFIDAIFNGSKTHVFISDYARDNRSICDDIEDMKGEIVTLRSHKNASSITNVVRVISGVRVKRVIHINIIKEIIGDINANCGECNDKYRGVLFCKTTMQHETYAWFISTLSPHTIIETVFVSYRFTNHVFWWHHNYISESARKCGGYSVADIHGYYFILDDRIQQYNRGHDNAKSHINHNSMSHYRYNDQYRQCFVEIELVR